MKEDDNHKRNWDYNEALAKLHGLFQSTIAGKENEIKNLMRAAVWVTPEIIQTEVQVFRDHGHKIYGAPYESDFQLVFWELTKFTNGTYTIDSDIFAIGSNMMIDLINFRSLKGKCKILLRHKVLKNVMAGSKNWVVEDII